MQKLGFRTGIFTDWRVERTTAELQGLGYDCVEICLERPDVRPEKLTESRCVELRQALDDMGMGIASLSYHADAEPLGERRANQFRAVQAAAWMGANILILNGEKSVDQATQWAEHVERFKALCEAAERGGVTIAVEPEPLLVVGSSQDMADLIGAVGSPNLGVNLDVGHAYITDPDLAATVRMLGSSIVHLHLEDIKDKVHRHLLMGEGDIDFGALRSTLAGIGYQGPYVIDLFGPNMEPLSTAKLAMEGLRRYFG